MYSILEQAKLDAEIMRWHEDLKFRSNMPNVLLTMTIQELIRDFLSYREPQEEINQPILPEAKTVWLKGDDILNFLETAHKAKTQPGGKDDGNPFSFESPAHEYWRRGYVHCLNQKPKP